MINFKKIELLDKEWMDPLIAAGDMRGCHLNFTNIFAWSEIYSYRVARVSDYLVVKGKTTPEGEYYFYPTGWGDITTVIEAMKLDAAECGHEFVLCGVSPENIAVMKNAYEGNFEYKAMRDSFDYVYLLGKLITLSGNKLHSKRNHINRFKESHNWSFEQISLDNLGECWEMNLQWCKIHDFDDDNMLEMEKCAVRRCFENFTALGLEGGLIRSDGEVIAFTMGEKLNSDTYVTHIEKAFGEIQGGYQMINHEFAALIKDKHPQMIYVNREEDMGYEGLRKAKLSYHPDKMEEKYLAQYIDG